jgi:hypothetical protein
MVQITYSTYGAGGLTKDTSLFVLHVARKPPSEAKAASPSKKSAELIATINV